MLDFPVKIYSKKNINGKLERNYDEEYKFYKYICELYTKKKIK